MVDAALVSRVHCRFTLSDTNELELEDLGSTNGTFVNGQKVTKVLLSDGDKLTVGRVEFVANSETSRRATIRKLRPSSAQPEPCSASEPRKIFENKRIRGALAPDGRLRPMS